MGRGHGIQERELDFSYGTEMDENVGRRGGACLLLFFFFLPSELEGIFRGFIKKREKRREHTFWMVSKEQ